MSAALKACLPLVVCFLAACSSAGKTSLLGAPAERAPQLLNGSYDKAEWQWERQIDGHFMLVHQVIPECFVATDWPMDIVDNAPATVSSRYFGGARYRVTEIPDGDEVGEAHYVRAETPFQLSAFGATRCQQAAEQLLITLEQRRAGQADAPPAPYPSR